MHDQPRTARGTRAIKAGALLAGAVTAVAPATALADPCHNGNGLQGAQASNSTQAQQNENGRTGASASGHAKAGGNAGAHARTGARAKSGAKTGSRGIGHAYGHAAGTGADVNGHAKSALAPRGRAQGRFVVSGTVDVSSHKARLKVKKLEAKQAARERAALSAKAQRIIARRHARMGWRVVARPIRAGARVPQGLALGWQKSQMTLGLGLHLGWLKFMTAAPSQTLTVSAPSASAMAPGHTGATPALGAPSLAAPEQTMAVAVTPTSETGEVAGTVTTGSGTAGSTSPAGTTETPSGGTSAGSGGVSAAPVGSTQRRESGAGGNVASSAATLPFTGADAGAVALAGALLLLAGLGLRRRVTA